MNNITAAQETIRITADRAYDLNGTSIRLPDIDYSKVIVISPDDGRKLLEQEMTPYMSDSMCRIKINNKDSFEAGRAYDNPLVMNFANAHNPGGGFKLGANAQEEALCRCSTLYASITSKAAGVMYSYNNTHVSRGAFGNRPEEVASYFKQLIVDEELGRAFEEICFAIYGSEDGKNIAAFRKCFGL